MNEENGIVMYTEDYLKISFLVYLCCMHLLFVPFIALLLFCCGDLELNPGPSTPFSHCPNCFKKVSIRVKICSCGHNMRKRSKAEKISHHVVTEIPTISQYCSNNDPMPQHPITQPCDSEPKSEY